MVSTSGATWRLAPALVTLLGQLRQAYPGQGWLGSPQTGTIGDQAHAAEGWTGSDHNPFLSPSGAVLPPGASGGVVRALDIAANVTGVPGIVAVTDAPDCEAIFAAVNRMYAAKDPRVFPDGYAIYNRRITDWNNPGGFHAQQGDPHLYHVHVSVSTNPAGFNSTAPWPLAAPVESSSSSSAVPVAPAAVSGGRVFRIIRNLQSGAVRACAPGFWASLEGKTPDESRAIIEDFRTDPLCVNNRVEDVSNARMQLIYNVYMKGHA